MIDLIGVATFAVPVVGETFDVVWAPISGYLVFLLYNDKFLSTVNFLEEILPMLDFIPTATIGWIMTYNKDIAVWVIRSWRSKTRSHEQKTD